MTNKARKARRIANRNLRVKTRKVNVTVVAVLTDGSRKSIKVPLTGNFVVIDSDGTKRLFERSGTYRNTVKRGISAMKLPVSEIRSARIILAA